MRSAIRLSKILIMTMTCMGILACDQANYGHETPSAQDGVTDNQAGYPIQLTWLGVTNWVLDFDGQTILFDAYFNRPDDGSESNEDGIDLFEEIRRAKSIDAVDSIFIGHSHFDHIVDAAPVALLTGAQVIGSQTTCYITQAQGLPESQCTVIDHGDHITIGSMTITAIRTIHWFPFAPAIGGYGVLDDVPSIETVQSGPNGGALSYLIKFSTRPDATIFMQGSLGELAEDDGSGEDYADNLKSAFEQRTEQTLWIGTGNFLDDPSELDLYLDQIRPAWIIPHHWDPISPTLRTGLNTSFSPQDWYADTVSAFGSKIIVPEQYFDEFIWDQEGVRRLDESAVRATGLFSSP